MENKERNEIDPELMEEFDEFMEDFDNDNVQLKSNWQLAKEQRYSKLDISVKQLDTIITLATAALIVVFIVIGLDARGVF